MIVHDGKSSRSTPRRRVALVVGVLALLAAYLVHPAMSSAAATYYVDAATGSDTNPGTSTEPWRTIQKAANTMLAGDTVRVRAGDYPERVQVTRSGAPGAAIMYEAEGSVTMHGFTVRADCVTIRGFDISNTPNAWDNGVGIFVEGSHAVIENNYVHFATRGGILLWAEPGDWGIRSDSVIRNNRLYRNGMVGVEFHGRNHLVEGNEVWRTIQYHPNWVPSPSYADADGMRFFGAGHVVRLNYIHDITYDDPENKNPHIDCFQTWGADYQEAGNNILFERNHCEVLETQTAHESGNAFMLAGAYNLTIRNNLLQAFKHINVAGGGCHHITIANNTFTSDLSFPTSNFPVGLDLENSPYVTAKNNIFYDLPGNIYYVTGSSSEGLDISHNLAYRSDGQTPWSTPYPNDLWSIDPQFQSPAADDYHLLSTSPAIDSGANMDGIVPDDFWGVTRPQASGYDRGLCEYGGTVPTPTPTITRPPPTATPTPVPLDVIVDNADRGFSAKARADRWNVYTDPAAEHYGGSHHYNHLIGDGSDVATWTAQVSNPGLYAVYAWWIGGEWRPADVPYVIQHAGGQAVVRVDQRINGGKWNLLGTYYFDGPVSVAVNDKASSGQDLVADAIGLRYEGAGDVAPTPANPSSTATATDPPAPTPTPTSPPPSATPTNPPTATPTDPPAPTPTPTDPPAPTPTPTVGIEIIVDDADQDFTTRAKDDAWQVVAEPGGQQWGETYHTNRLLGDGKDVATWRPKVPASGWYALYVWWSDGTQRPPDVPYIISHLDGEAVVRVDQRANGGQWNLLGTYRFSGKAAISVQDDATSGRDIVADAVRLVYAGP